MTAEKRTIGSEIRELIAEIQDGWRAWRNRGKVEIADSDPVSAPLREQVFADLTQQAWGSLAEQQERKEQESQDEADGIIFTPLDPGASTPPLTRGRAGAAGAVAPVASICPVTRQTIDLNGAAYQCRLCGIYYSREGWEFLRQAAKGQCCGCRNVKTVLPVVKTR